MIDKLQQVFSIYSVVVLLGIGIYMGFVQSQTLSKENYLERETVFSKWVGYFYIVVGIIGGIIWLI